MIKKLERFYNKIFTQLFIKRESKRVREFFKDISFEKEYNRIQEKEFEYNSTFTESFIYDRIIHKDNTCDLCHRYFGEDYSNIIISEEDENKITTIICKLCNNEMRFINWNYNN